MRLFRALFRLYIQADKKNGLSISLNPSIQQAQSTISNHQKRNDLKFKSILLTKVLLQPQLQLRNQLQLSQYPRRQ